MTWPRPELCHTAPTLGANVSVAGPATRRIFRRISGGIPPPASLAEVQKSRLHRLPPEMVSPLTFSASLCFAPSAESNKAPRRPPSSPSSPVDSLTPCLSTFAVRYRARLAAIRAMPSSPSTPPSKGAPKPSAAGSSSAPSTRVTAATSSAAQSIPAPPKAGSSTASVPVAPGQVARPTGAPPTEVIIPVTCGVTRSEGFIVDREPDPSLARALESREDPDDDGVSVESPPPLALDDPSTPVRGSDGQQDDGYVPPGPVLLGCADGRYPLMDTSGLRFAWEPTPRRGFTVEELRALPTKRTDVLRFLGFAEKQPHEAVAALRRWYDDGPLYQVPSGVECERTFVGSRWDALYVEAANAGLNGGSDRMPLHTPGVYEYPFLWQVDTEIRRRVQTSWGLTQLRGVCVDPVDFAAYRARGSDPIRVDKVTTLLVDYTEFAPLPPFVRERMPPYALTMANPPVLRFFGLKLSTARGLLLERLTAWLRFEWSAFLVVSVKLDIEQLHRVVCFGTRVLAALRDAAVELPPIPHRSDKLANPYRGARVDVVAREISAVADEAVRSKFRRARKDHAVEKKSYYVYYDPELRTFVNFARDVSVPRYFTKKGAEVLAEDPAPLSPSGKKAGAATSGPAFADQPPSGMKRPAPTRSGTPLVAPPEKAPKNMPVFAPIPVSAPPGLPPQAPVVPAMPLHAIRFGDASLRASFPYIFATLHPKSSWSVEELLCNSERLVGNLRSAHDALERSKDEVLGQLGRAEADLHRIRSERNRLRDDLAKAQRCGSETAPSSYYTRQPAPPNVPPYPSYGVPPSTQTLNAAGDYPGPAGEPPRPNPYATDSPGPAPYYPQYTPGGGR